MADLENSYDISTPGGDDDPREADDKMREIKAAVQERMNDHDSEPDEGDHFWPFDSVETTEVKDEDTGQHRKVTLRQMTDNPSDLTSYADTTNLGFLYQKDISSNGELFYQDEADRVIQVTDAGKLNIEDEAINSDQIADGAVDLVHMSSNSVDTPQYVNDSIQEVHLQSGAITAGFSPATESGDTDASGTTTFPNGLVMRRGSTSINAFAEEVVDLSTYFTKIYHAQLTWREDTTANRYSPKLSNIANQSINIRNTNPNAIDCYYFVIGW